MARLLFLLCAPALESLSYALSALSSPPTSAYLIMPVIAPKFGFHVCWGPPVKGAFPAQKSPLNSPSTFPSREHGAITISKGHDTLPVLTSPPLSHVIFADQFR